MEYEIKDEPQGQAERTEGDRKGGLREDHTEVRKRKEREAVDAVMEYDERIFFSQMG